MRVSWGLLLGGLAVLTAWPAAAAPVSLDALIGEALSTHPALVALRETAGAQDARARAATSPYWPQLNLSSGASQTTNVSQAQTTAQPFSLLSGGLSLRQQLWDFGKTADAVTAAEAGAIANHRQADLQAVEVAFGVRRAYMECLRADGLLAQSEARLKSAETLHAQALAFWQAGRRPKIDVTRAEASVLQARADLATARNTVAAARITLAAAMGRPETVEVGGGFPAPSPLAGRPLDELIDLAQAHPSLQVVQARSEQSEAQSRLADKTNWPAIVADGNYGLRARDLTPSQNWAAGVSVNMPLFTGFADARQQEAAAAQWRSTQASARDTRLQVRLGIERAALTVDGARARLEALRAAVRSANENLGLAEGRYRVGVGSVIEVSDAQTLAANAQADLVRAEADYHIAIADLLRAVGRTGVEA